MSEVRLSLNGGSIFKFMSGISYFGAIFFFSIMIGGFWGFTENAIAYMMQYFFVIPFVSTMIYFSYLIQSRSVRALEIDHEKLSISYGMGYFKKEATFFFYTDFKVKAEYTASMYDNTLTVKASGKEQKFMIYQASELTPLNAAEEVKLPAGEEHLSLNYVVEHHLNLARAEYSKAMELNSE